MFFRKQFQLNGSFRQVSNLIGEASTGRFLERGGFLKGSNSPRIEPTGTGTPSPIEAAPGRENLDRCFYLKGSNSRTGKLTRTDSLILSTEQLPEGRIRIDLMA
jgi:hypothetical protein